MPSVNELSARAGPQTDKQFVRIYRRSFEVMFADNEPFGGALANIATGVSLWQSHPEDAAALCIGFDPKQSPDEDRYWTVDLQYSSAVEIAEDGQPPSQQHPLERKARVRKSGRRYTEAVTKDINGTPIRNAAHDPYDHTEERVRSAFLIQRNLPHGQSYGGKPPFSEIDIADYMGAINKVPFLDRQVWEVLCEDLDAELRQEEGLPFWEVTAVFVIKKSNVINGVEQGTWLTTKLNAGFRALTAAGKWVEIRDQFGRPRTRPALLNEDGTERNPGTAAAPNGPLFLHFHTKPEADFADLGLLT